MSVLRIAGALSTQLYGQGIRLLRFLDSPESYRLPAHRTRILSKRPFKTI
jgi:hypothetical protein